MTKDIFKNKILEDASVTLRAVSKKDDIICEFYDVDDNFFAINQNLISGEKIILPKFSDIILGRANIDLAACYLLFHDKKIHEKFATAEQKLFDSFEKIRVIANIKDYYLGAIKNILEKINNDVQNLDLSGLEAFPLLLLNEIFPQKIKTELSKTDKEIDNFIKKIAQNIYNQEAFASEVERFIDFLKNRQENNKSTKNQEEKQKESKKSNEIDGAQNEENIESKPNQQGEIEEKNSEEKSEKNEDFQEIKNSEEISMQIKSSANQQNQDIIEFKKLYKFYTSKFDEIILPQKLITKNELEILRYSLDLRISKLGDISRKLTLSLKRKLLSKKNSIEESKNDGILDRKKLTQIITNPFDENFFITQKHHEYQDTIVSILLDNSGSMRGQPIVMAALASEIIAKILEKFTVKTEILGFTTADWRGGKSRKAWEMQGRQENPGRLNDLRHIIYKSANQNFKKAKINLGLMLKEGILKENIDGEALLWAKSRLMQREEKRKILMIISDGTPVDDSTNSTNKDEILVDHLHHVIKKIEKENKIEIVGIGIGHNVADFYQNSISIKNIEELGDVMIKKIVDLI